MKINNKETALLGLLNEKPMHGYEIEQEIRQRDMRYWTEISISSIYKILKKLEEKEYVKTEVKLTQNNVAQKISTITAKGKAALKSKVCSLFTEFDHHKWELDLAITNLGILKSGEAEKCISEYIVKMEELVNGYGELQKYLESENCPEYRMALAKRPQYLYKAEIEWAKEYRKLISNK
ncbi:MAG: PadR family transcriptional regulator [Bacteroidales bacterium]|nr:PadR family transcriptional regulator [Bacteroidales bacterium]